MAGITSNYTVSAQDAPFTTESGKTFLKSVIITYYDSSGNEVANRRYGLPEMTDIYNSVYQFLEINLDQCYVNGFSSAVYRKIYEIDKQTPVKIKAFSARNAFFESTVSSDFSLIQFCGPAIFCGSQFGKGKTQFTGSHFNELADFSETTFHTGNIEFRGAHFGDGDFLFKNSFFASGVRDFSDIRFGRGEVSFANTEFSRGELLFINTHFSDGKFSFKVARIEGGRVEFHYASFGTGEIIFERTEFGDSKVDFRAVDFGKGRVNFNRSVFGNGEVNFEGASCREGKILFKRATFGNGNKNFKLLEMSRAELNFEKTLFGDGDLSFDGSKFDSLILRSCYLNYYVDLRVTYARFVDLSDTIVRDIIDLETYDHEINIETLNMAGMRLIGKVYIDWELNRCNELIISQKDNTSNRQKADQFRILKVNFNQTGKYDDEDKAYILFKRFEAKAILDDYSTKGIVMRTFGWVSNGFRWLVFDAAGLYATNPLRVLFSMGVGYLVFSLIFYLQIKFTDADIISSTPDQLADLPRAFYHSAITFFTIGYGDHFPHGAARVVSGIEGFIGVFLMAYFTVAFVRKVLR